MAPTAAQTSKGYAHLWDEATVTRSVDASKQADSMIANKARYKAVAAQMNGIPWAVVACLAVRESNQNFRAHLHNGDSLARRTHQVPAGRPVAPPANGIAYTWEESALDALKMRNLHTVGAGNWTIERALYEEEAYNGWGYLGHGNSPYIWSWTNEYHGGKYVADHVYDPNEWDKQPGCAALLKELSDRDAETKAFVNRRSGTFVPRDVNGRATKNERTTTGVGAGTATAGAGTEVATNDVHNGVAHYFLVYGLLGIGLVVLVFAATMMVKKQALIKAKFQGGVPLPPPSNVALPAELQPQPQETAPAPAASSDPTLQPMANAAGGVATPTPAPTPPPPPGQPIEGKPPKGKGG